MSAKKTKKTAKVADNEVTAVDLIIRLQIKGSVAQVTKYRAAIQALAEVMVVQAENGLWSLGYEDAESGDVPNEYVADIEHTHVHGINYTKLAARTRRLMDVVNEKEVP